MRTSHPRAPTRLPTRRSDEKLLRRIASKGRRVQLDDDVLRSRGHLETLVSDLRRASFWCVERERDEDCELLFGDLIGTMFEPAKLTDAIHSEPRLEAAVKRGLKLIVVVQ
ncbi:MAG: hypothetical protein WCH83_15770 [Alphaproteobacteria bacterium]|jgi:hypothetical protein